jgi:ribonuclease P/MRP protein subunit RPP1
MFFDLNLKPRKSHEQDKEFLLQRAFEFGWDNIAWNTSVTGVPKIQIKPVELVLFTPLKLKSATSMRCLTSSNQNLNLTQLNRITLQIEDVNDAQSITSNNEYLKPFDIVAACPLNANVFTHLCKTAEIDIISIDFAQRIPFPMTKKLVSF